MARPKGLPLSRPAFHDLLRIRCESMSEVAAAADMPLTTLSGLVHGDHGASPRTARRLANALGVDVATLFPALLHARYDDDELVAS